jgi:hypothetical protein
MAQDERAPQYPKKETKKAGKENLTDLVPGKAKEE